MRIMQPIIINDTINLDRPVTTNWLKGDLFSGEAMAHAFKLTAVRDGEPVALSGTVTGRFVRANYTSILLGGSIVDGKAYVELPQDCYNVPGRFEMVIMVTDSDRTVCTYSIVGNVRRTQIGDLIDSGDIVPDIDNILNVYDDMQAAVTHANEMIDAMKATFPVATAGPAAVVAVDDAAPLPPDALTVAIAASQSGEGDPSPDNIRPITGWTGANVLHGSFPDDVTWIEGKVIDANGAVIDSSIGGAYSSLIPLETGQYVHLYGVTTAQGRILRVHGYNSSGEWVRQLANSTKAQIGQYFVTLAITSDIKYIRITTGRFSSYNPIIIGTNAPFSWQTQAGTVYGGTLDVLTGVLTVTHAATTVGSYSWRHLDTWADNVWGTATQIPNIYGDRGSVYSDTFATYGSAGIDENAPTGVINKNNSPTNGYIYVKDTAYSTAEEFAQGRADAVIVYQLATPNVYQLTPAQVTMLTGANTIWADCGDTTLTYRANPYDRLLSRIEALEEDSLGKPSVNMGWMRPIANYFDTGSSSGLSVAWVDASDDAPVRPTPPSSAQAQSDTTNDLMEGDDA